MSHTMFSGDVARTPINSVAAKVASQKGCVSEVTPQQEKDSALARLDQVHIELKAAPRGSVEKKRLGAENLALTTRVGELNKKLRVINRGDRDREKFLECLFHVLGEQLTPFHYKRIMRLAREKQENEL